MRLSVFGFGADNLGRSSIRVPSQWAHAMLAMLMFACPLVAHSQSTKTVEPIEDQGFGLAVQRKITVDFSYLPFTHMRPFGDKNCGTVDSPFKPGSPRGYQGTIAGYAPFAEFSTATIYKNVRFRGDGDDAIGCLILLSKVMKKKFQDNLLSSADYDAPILFGWQDTLFLKYDPARDTSLIWIPVLPNAEERKDVNRFLQKSAHHFANTIGQSLDDWRASRTKLTTGYRDKWVTVSVSKDRDGTLTTKVVSGMAIN